MSAREAWLVAWRWVRRAGDRGRDAIPWRLRGAAIRAFVTRVAMDETERAALGRSW